MPARLALSLVLALAGLSLAAVPVTAQDDAPTVYGVAATEDGGIVPLPLPPPIGPEAVQRLFSFPADDPGQVTEVDITGLGEGELVVGIDLRPATGELFAVTSGSQLYTIDLTTGAATPEGEPFTPALDEAVTTVGFDFNPVVDRIRLVTGTTNLRLNPDDASVTEDGDLAYADGDPNAGTEPEAAGAGYTNSQPGPPAMDRTTQLFVLDGAADALVLQAPPNDGVLTTVADVGFDVGPETHLDVAGATTAYVADGTSFSSLDLTDGSVTPIGEIATDGTITGLAVETDQETSQPGLPAGTLGVAATSGGRLLLLELDGPGVVGPGVPILGLGPGEAVTGLDFRPITGTLYAVTDGPALYTIDLGSGQATQVGPAEAMPLDVVVDSLDFNPTVDLLRYQGSSGDNRRVSPDTAAITTLDGDLRYVDGDPNAGTAPSVTGSAYTNSFGGASMTMLLTVDSELDVLAVQAPPNDGALTTVDDLGVDLGPGNGFDIGQDGVAHLAGEIDGSQQVATVALPSGVVTVTGEIASGPMGLLPGEEVTAFAVVTRVGRLAGADRFATSAQVSRRTFEPGVPVAYVASGEDFPDALAGGPAAAVADGPVLLVGRDQVPAPTMAELDRLQPQEIVILGGTAAVSSGVETALVPAEGGTVRRIAGPDRFSTAAAVATDSFEPGVPVLYVATGFDFADALTGGAAAAVGEGPLLLTATDDLPQVTADAVTALDPARVVVLGGTAAVSESVVGELEELVDVAVEVERLSGADRFATAAAVARDSFPGDVERALVATGRGFADALTAVPTVGVTPGPVLLVEPTAIPGVIADVLEEQAPAFVSVVGGRAAVSEEVERALYDLVG